MSTLPIARGWAVVVLLGATALGAAGPDDSKTKAEPPSSDSVLQRTADFYQKAKSFAVEVDREQKVGPNVLKSEVAVAVDQPNKMAIRTKGNGLVIDLISDGKTLSVSVPSFKQYTQSKAPASRSEITGDPTLQGILMATLQGTMIVELTAADPYKALMDGVKTSRYLGEEVVDGVKTHHVKCTQDQFDWEVWVAAEGDPLLRKVVMDMTKSVANTPVAAQLKGQKLILVQTFKDWKINAPLDAKTFAFEPGPDAKKADSLMEMLTAGAGGGGGGEEAPSALVGKPAPDIKLALLDKSQFQLQDHRDKNIVMLDFWATWCGPCVQELPILTEVAESYKGKGVAFVGINLQETPEQVKEFQEEKKLKFTVALDTEGKVGTAYNAQAIPMLVLVDKKGVVRSVHIGYSPSIKKTLTAELDALLAGKDIPAKVVDQPKAKPATPKTKTTTKTDGPELERAWSVDGPYLSVATDPKGRTIFAVQPGGRCDVLDLDGKKTRTMRLDVDSRQAIILRGARQAGGKEGFLAFGPWGLSVTALKDDGAKVWEETSGQGVDDVWAADLDGDGVDEAIVGYNGATGLHVFTPKGTRLWSRTDLGNVWNVTAGDLDGDGTLEVISTSAQGKVHVFAAKDGTPLTPLDAGIYATKVRVAHGRAKAPSKGDLLLVAGSDFDQKGEALVALGVDGEALWTTKLPTASAASLTLAVSPDGRLAALSFQGGLVCVVDVGTGQIIGQVADQGLNPTVAWGTSKNGVDNLVLVSTGNAVSAFRAKAPATSRRNNRP